MFSREAIALLRMLPATRSPRVVLIDGPSGAGKSSLADALVAAWPDTAPTLVRLDDLYPGWDGLDAASVHIVESLLGPLRSGGGRWRRYDWRRSIPGSWEAVDEFRDLIVEGCGAISRASAPLAALRVWVTASDAVRKPRALRRDAGAFDEHWEAWDRQFRRFVARERPVELCDAVVDTTLTPSTLTSSTVRRTVGGMTDQAPQGQNPTDQNPAERTYTAVFLDGPLANRVDERGLDADGGYEQRFSAYALVNSLESQFWYEAVDAREVDGRLQVNYRFDEQSSDSVNGGLPNDQESIDPAGP